MLSANGTSSDNEPFVSLTAGVLDLTSVLCRSRCRVRLHETLSSCSCALHEDILLGSPV